MAYFGSFHTVALPLQFQPYLPVVVVRQISHPDVEYHAEDPLHGAVQGGQRTPEHPGTRKLVHHLRFSSPFASITSLSVHPSFLKGCQRVEHTAKNAFHITIKLYFSGNNINCEHLTNKAHVKFAKMGEMISPSCSVITLKKKKLCYWNVKHVQIKLCTLTLGDDINHMFQGALVYTEKNNHHNNNNHWTLKCVVKVGC